MHNVMVHNFSMQQLATTCTLPKGKAKGGNKQHERQQNRKKYAFDIINARKTFPSGFH